MLGFRFHEETMASSGISVILVIIAVVINVPIATLCPCDTNSPSNDNPFISHTWLSKCSDPEAGRELPKSNMANPVSTNPENTLSMATGSRERSASGDPIRPRKGNCTKSHTFRSTGSTPNASAINQSAPPVIFATRSPYPEEIMDIGAFRSTVTSATTSRGGVQGIVCLNPCMVMGAFGEVYPSTEGAVGTQQ
jgi:hypothetical protein